MHFVVSEDDDFYEYDHNFELEAARSSDSYLTPNNIPASREDKTSRRLFKIKE